MTWVQGLRMPVSSQRRPRRWLAVPAVGACVLAASCSGGVADQTQGGGGAAVHQSALPESLASAEALAGQERESALLRAAREEGTVSVYSAYNDEAKVAEAFEKKYGIHVDTYVANSESVRQRALQEDEAGKTLNDVYVGPSVDCYVLDKRGLFSDYRSPGRDAVDQAGKGEHWTGVRRLAFVAGYNTDVLKPSDLPPDYAGFASPAWKGRISMELNDVDWYLGVSDWMAKNGKSPDEIRKTFSAIAANSKVAKGHTVQGQLLVAGQFDVALSLYSQTVERLVDKKAPAQWRQGDAYVKPVVVRYDAAAAMAHAKHPAAAALYLDFLLGPGGAAVDVANGALPPVPTADDPLAGVETIAVDTRRLVEEGAELSKAYDSFLRHGARVAGGS